MTTSSRDRGRRKHAEMSAEREGSASKGERGSGGAHVNALVDRTLEYKSVR